MEWFTQLHTITDEKRRLVYVSLVDREGVITVWSNPSFAIAVARAAWIVQAFDAPWIEHQSEE